MTLHRYAYLLVLITSFPGDRGPAAIKPRRALPWRVTGRPRTPHAGRHDARGCVFLGVDAATECIPRLRLPQKAHTDILDSNRRGRLDVKTIDWRSDAQLPPWSRSRPVAVSPARPEAGVIGGVLQEEHMDALEGDPRHASDPTRDENSILTLCCDVLKA